MIAIFSLFFNSGQCWLLSKFSFICTGYVLNHQTCFFCLFFFVFFWLFWFKGNSGCSIYKLFNPTFINTFHLRQAALSFWYVIVLCFYIQNVTSYIHSWYCQFCILSIHYAVPVSLFLLYVCWGKLFFIKLIYVLSILLIKWQVK